MTRHIDQHITLELISAQHASPIFQMVDSNRTHLRPWLGFVDHMNDITFAHNFVRGAMDRHQAGNEYAFVIFEDEVAVGRIGIYKIDRLNLIGEIGYWVIRERQGRGIVSKACRDMLDLCFNDLHLNRVEIKCAKENYKSALVPQRLGFTREGLLRQAESINGRFNDLLLFSMLREDYQSRK